VEAWADETKKKKRWKEDRRWELTDPSHPFYYFFNLWNAAGIHA